MRISSRRAGILACQAIRAGRFTDLPALLLILGTWLAILYRQLLMGEAVFVGDTAWVFYPLRALGAARLQAGEIGVWDPHLFGGLPFAADPQSQVFYPLHLLLLVFSVPGAMSVSLALHYLLMLLGAYLLGRRCLHVGPLPAAVLALAFTFSGPALARSSNSPYPETLAWLPWALVALDWSLRAGPALRLLAPAAILAMQLLVGAPQYTYYTLIVMLGLALYRYLQSPRGALRLRALLGVPVTAAAAAVLAMVQLLPTAEMARLSDRMARWSYEVAVTGSLPLKQFLNTLIYPHMYGAADAPELDGFALSSYLGYVGIITLSLAMIALVSAPRRRAVSWLGGLGVLSLLLAMGGDNPLYPLLYRIVPGLALFRCPAAIIVLACLSLAALAALGLDALLAGGLRNRALAAVAALVPLLAALVLLPGAAARLNEWILLLHPAWPYNHLALVIISCVPVLVLLAIRRIRLRERLAAACVLLLALDLVLFSFDTDLSLTLPNYRILRSADSVGFLRHQQGPLRVWNLSGGLPLRYYLPGADIHGGDRLRCRSLNAAATVELLEADLPAAFQLDGLNGAWGAMLPLARHVPSIYVMPRGEVQYQWLDLLNVRYYTAMSDDAIPAHVKKVLHTQFDLRVWESPTAAPRAFLAARALPVADAQEAIRRIEAEIPFPYREKAYVEGLPEQVDFPTPAATQGNVTWEQRGPERYVLHAEADGDCWLVVSDNYYPGWRAMIDGRPAPLYPANGVMRAVPVPAGEHRVVMYYVGAALLVGMFGSLCALAAACALVTFFYMQRRQGGNDAIGRGALRAPARGERRNR